MNKLDKLKKAFEDKVDSAIQVAFEEDFSHESVHFYIKKFLEDNLNSVLLSFLGLRKNYSFDAWELDKASTAQSFFKTILNEKVDELEKAARETLVEKIALFQIPKDIEKKLYAQFKTKFMETFERDLQRRVDYKLANKAESLANQIAAQYQKKLVDIADDEE